MKPGFAFYLLALAPLLSTSVQAVQTAQADLVNSSIRMGTGACDCDIGGLIWHMDFSTAYTEERLQANRELAPSPQPAGYSHWSYLILEDPSMWTSTSVMKLNLPADDLDGNGMPDFLEIGIPAANVSQGTYEIEWGPCPLTVTWSRAAGATTGGYQVTLHDLYLGEIGPFTGSFELVRSRGSLTYTPGATEVLGTVAFPATSVSSALQGPLRLVKSPTDPFNNLTLQSGALTNEFENLPFDTTALTRKAAQPSVYLGSFLLQTAYFQAWSLVITDPNDSDHDTIPDLSDGALPPSANPPILTLASAPGGLQLTIPGNSGRTCRLEESLSLSPSLWQLSKTFTLTNDPHVLLLPQDTASSKFWRVLLQ